MSSGGTVLVGGSTGTSTGGGAGTSGAPQVSPGACPFALCETFEDAAVGSPPSSAVWKSAAGIVVDTVHAFRGTKALHVPPIKTGHFMIETTKGLPLPGKVMFGRVYLWIENTPKLGGSYLHQSFVTASGKNAAGADMDHYFGGQSRSGWEGAFTFPSYNSWSGSGGHGGPANAHHPVGFKVKSWECLEWSYDTPQNKATFWNNGTELTAIGFTNAGKPVYDFPEMRAIAIGVTEFHSGDAPWEVWFDEFAIGPTRIGCLP